MLNRYNSNNRHVLDMDAIRMRAPSVFAETPSALASDKYRFISTFSVVAKMISQGFNCVAATEQRIRKEDKRGFQKHQLRFTRPDLMINEGSVDIVYTNSHDLTSGASMSAAFWRKVCSNGLHVSATLLEPIRVKHVGSKVEDFINASFRIVEDVPRVTESIQAMQSLELREDERMFLAQASLIAKYGAPTEENKLPLAAATVLRPRRYDDQKKDLWTTFNVIQENLIQGGQRDHSQSYQARRTRGVTSLTENTKLNQALWSLAESMKQLKAA